MSQYIYRLRAPKGLDSTLIKDLRWQLGLTAKQAREQIREIPGRKAIEVRGDQAMLWRLLVSSRIAEDIQLKTSKEFLARGEKELQSNLNKVPWHCYMPSDERHSEYEMPKTTAKTHQSKLFHSKLARNLLLSHINELPIKRAFKRLPISEQVKYSEFKKKWIRDHDKVRSTTKSFVKA